MMSMHTVAEKSIVMGDRVSVKTRQIFLTYPMGMFHVKHPNDTLNKHIYVARKG